jgi:hypothetical protein
MSRLKLPLRCFKVIFFTLIFCQLRAGTYYTIADGYWGTPNVWLNSQIPPLTGSDSIYIRNSLTYSYSITFTSSTYILIDSTGSLCGHRRIFVPNGSSIDNYGELYADTLVINGGIVTNYNLVYLTNMAALTAGGSFANNGMMQIGAIFLCQEENIGSGINEQISKATFRIYPLPAKNGEEIHIEDLPSECSILIFNLTGQLLLEEKMSSSGTFFTSGLSAGTYLLSIRQNDKTTSFYRKLIITD